MKRKLLFLFIYLLSIGSYKCLSQNSINLVLKKYGCYSEYGISQADASNIAAIGFKYVIYYAKGQPYERVISDIRYMKNAGLSIIFQISSLNYAVKLCPKLSNNTNIIGWYILDEVDANKIPISDQNLIINKIKQISSLPIFGSANVDNFPINRISDKYDYIFISNYINSNYNDKNNNLKNLSFIMSTYGSALASIGGVFGMNKCIPVYEDYFIKGNYDFSEKQLLDIWSVKSKLYGKPGPFFIYNAGSTTPKMGTMKNNIMLSNAAKTFIKTNTVFGAPLMHAHSVTDYYNSKSMGQYDGNVNRAKEMEPFEKLVDLSKSTIKIKHSIISKVPVFGYHINSGEYLTLDFGETTKFAQIFMLYYQSYGVVDGIFSFHRVIEEKNFKLEKIGSNFIIKHNGKSSRKSAAITVENLNSRYLVIKSEMSERYNNYTAFEYLGYVTCKENPYTNFKKE